jgi:hypothetical protein
MSDIIETLKKNNPFVYQILQEQGKHKWEITGGERHETVSETYPHISEKENDIKCKSNQICQHGVKF